MSTMREPRFVSYRTVVTSEDGTLLVARSEHGDAEVAIVAAPPGESAWDTAFRTSDRRASIELADGTHAISQFPLFDPTWYGAYDWLRHGFAAAASSATPSPAPTVVPSPVATSTDPPLVAIVRAIDSSNYVITDGGEATCPDGRAARRLNMEAKTDPSAHPLTGATVDGATLRFCAMRFREHVASPGVVFDADIELKFAQAGSYYLVVGGDIHGAVRPVRRPGWFRMNASFAYRDMTFPDTLPDARFALQVTE
jgi:hypothetical protein